MSRTTRQTGVEMAEAQDPGKFLGCQTPPPSKPFLLPVDWGPRLLARRALGPGPHREQLQKLPWAWMVARPGLLGVVPPPWEPAHLTLLPASACRVVSEDRSGQYSCIFLPEHAGRTDLEVKGRLQG